MEPQSPTPDGAPAPAGGTPAPAPAAAAAPVAEPAAPPAAPAATADQPAIDDPKLAQAEYTRSQQAFAALRQELGLEGKPTRDEILEAVRQMRAQGAAPAGGGEEVDEDDPAVIAARQRAEAAEQRAHDAELRVQRAMYGEDFSKAIIDTANAIRQTDDVGEIFSALAAFKDQWAAADPAPAPAPANPGPPRAGDIGLSEGDRSPSVLPQQQPPGRQRESGVIGAVRGIFREAAERAATRS